MKYSIIFALICASISEKTECPQTGTINTMMCVQTYAPVCGHNFDGKELGTYQNGCYACRDSQALYYDSEPCVLSTSSSNSTTTSNDTIFKCSATKSSTCDAVYTPTCGLFNSNIQCVKAPCGSVFANECEACANVNVDSYFYGDCSEQSTKINNDYVECTIPRPEICTTEYTDTCAFTEFPCSSVNCQRDAGNHCEACMKTYVGYVPMKCSDYALVLKKAKFICSTTRPTDCDEVVNQVCAQFQCNDATCEKEFTNECLACSNTAVTSYYRGFCQASFVSYLSFALIISMIL